MRTRLAVASVLRGPFSISCLPSSRRSGIGLLGGILSTVKVSRAILECCKRLGPGCIPFLVNMTSAREMSIYVLLQRDVRVPWRQHSSPLSKQRPQYSTSVRGVALQVPRLCMHWRGRRSATNRWAKAYLIGALVSHRSRPSGESLQINIIVVYTCLNVRLLCLCLSTRWVSQMHQCLTSQRQLIHTAIPEPL